jgi:ATP-dependent DNA ligase
VCSQRRATTHRVQAPAMPAVFDLLAHRGEDLRRLPYRERRARLVQLLGDQPAGLCPVPATGDPSVRPHGWGTATAGSKAWWPSGATRAICRPETSG